MAKHSYKKSKNSRKRYSKKKYSGKKSCKKTSRRKRCPKGSRRSGRKCVSTKPKRCPNGSRRNKETGNCILKVVKIIEQEVKNVIKEKVEQKIMNELKEEIKENPNVMIPLIEQQAEKTATKEVIKMIQTDKKEYLNKFRNETDNFYESLSLHELVALVTGQDDIEQYFHNKENIDIIKRLVDEAIDVVSMQYPDIREEDKIVFELQKRKLEEKFNKYLIEMNNMKVQDIVEYNKSLNELELFKISIQNQMVERLLEEFDNNYTAGMLMSPNDVPRYYRRVARNVQRKYVDEHKSDIVKHVIKDKLWEKIDQAKKNKDKYIEL
jgi:hypothetical protein